MCVTVFKARGRSLMYEVMTFKTNLYKSQKHPQHKVQPSMIKRHVFR